MTITQALLLALIQGVGELFPVSSLGHTILVPAILHWNRIDRADPGFLAFVVALHLGTALALVVFYRRDWIAIVGALVRSVVRGRIGDDPNEKIGWLLVVGTIPVGILGITFEHPVRLLFGSVAYAAMFLVVNGLIMFWGERMRRRQHEDRHRAYRPLEELTFLESILIGIGQSFALLPGISRSGASMTAGLLFDLDHSAAARYSFLLATPAIGAAGLLEVPKFFEPTPHAMLGFAVLGGLVSGIAAYASVAFLTRYFRSHDLRPFGWYCTAAGCIALVLSWKGVIR